MKYFIIEEWENGEILHGYSTERVAEEDFRRHCDNLLLDEERWVKAVLKDENYVLFVEVNEFGEVEELARHEVTRSNAYVA